MSCVERPHMSAQCRASGLGRHQHVNVSFQHDECNNMQATASSKMPITNKTPVFKPLPVTILSIIIQAVIRKIVPVYTNVS
jgi:hypothetical protein